MTKTHKVHVDLASWEQRLDQKTLQIAVVGFGYIGTCIGAVLAGRGYRVKGIDVRKDIVDSVNKGQTPINEPGLGALLSRVVSAGQLSATTHFSALREADAVVVTVGTPLKPDFTPETREIVEAMSAVAEHLKSGALVILKSTVPPFTTRDVVQPLLDQRSIPYALAFCPERLAEGRAIAEFESIPVVVGGVDKASTLLASLFWQKTMGLKTIEVDNAESAELVKLADNLWIDLNVALANELALVSEKLQVDALQVIQAANSLPKGQHHVNILHPSLGVGGYCLTKDPWFVHALGKKHGLELRTPVASRQVNDSMPDHSFRMIREALAKTGKSLNTSKVAVLGVSFKNNTGDCRFTPTQSILKNLADSGCALEIYDPWVSDEDAHHVVGKSLNKDLSMTLRAADCVAFFTGHDEFRAIPIEQLAEQVKPGAVFFDGRNFFDRKKIEESLRRGFHYVGVGR